MQNIERQNDVVRITPAQREKSDAFVDAAKKGEVFDKQLEALNTELTAASLAQANAVAERIQEGVGRGRYVSVMPNWMEGRPLPAGFRIEIGTRVQNEWSEAVGAMAPSNAVWDKKSLDARLGYFQEKYESGDGNGSEFTLQEMYGFEATVDRTQAAQIATKFHEALQEGKRPENVENWKNLMIEAQLRVTHREVYADALEQYNKLFDRYERIKAECRQIGMKEADIVNVKLDGAAQTHYTKVLATARKRRELTLNIWKKNGRDNETGQFKYDLKEMQEIDKLDTELWNLLKSDDQENGIPPVHTAMVELLQKRYTHLVSRVDADEDDTEDNKLSSKEVREIRARVQANNIKILAEIRKKSQANEWQRFLGQNIEIDEDHLKELEADPSRILAPKDEATRKAYEAVAKEVLGEEDYARHMADVRALQTKEKISSTLFKRLGSDHVNEVVQLHGELIRYQARRARLTTVRHHFQNVYGLDTENPPADGKPDTEALKAFAKANNESALNAIDEHLDYVEDNVLKRGLLVRMEDFHNKEVRYYFSHMAMLLTDIETMWLPRAPDTSEGEWPGPAKYLQRLVTQPRNQVRDALVGEIPRLMGWPQYASGPRKGEWKDIGDLTPSEKAAMKTKQTSVLDALKNFEQSGVQTQLRATVSTLRDITGDISPEELVSLNYIDPDDVEAARKKIPEGVDINTPEGRAKALEAFAKDVGPTQAKRLLILIALEDLEDATDRYNEEYAKMMHDFHKVVGDHVDWDKAAMEFAEGQSKVLLLYALGIIGAGVLIAYLRRRRRKNKERKRNRSDERTGQGEQNATSQLSVEMQQTAQALRIARDNLQRRIQEKLDLEQAAQAEVDFASLHGEWLAFKKQVADIGLESEIEYDAAFEAELKLKAGK